LILDIEWPEGDEALSTESVNVVEALLTMDPFARPLAKQVLVMNFFKDIDWKNIENMEPPFVPNPDDPHDTGYFEGEREKKNHPFGDSLISVFFSV
jgi:serine/threonine-protein kinase greatwall